MHAYCNPPDSFYMPGTRAPRYSLVVCLELWLAGEIPEGVTGVSGINHAQYLSLNSPRSWAVSCHSDAKASGYVSVYVGKYKEMYIFNRESKSFDVLAGGAYNWDLAAGEIKEYPPELGMGGHKEIIVLDIYPEKYLTDSEGYKYAHEQKQRPEYVVDESNCAYRRPTLIIDLLEDYSDITLECITLGISNARCCGQATCEGQEPTYYCGPPPNPGDPAIPCLTVVYPYQVDGEDIGGGEGGASGGTWHYPCGGPCPGDEVCYESIARGPDFIQCFDTPYNITESEKYAEPPRLKYLIRDNFRKKDYVQVMPGEMYALNSDNISFDEDDKLNFMVVQHKEVGPKPILPICTQMGCPNGMFGPIECTGGGGNTDDTGATDPGADTGATGDTGATDPGAVL